MNIRHLGNAHLYPLTSRKYESRLAKLCVGCPPGRSALIKKINELVDKLVEGDNKKDKILRVPGKVNEEDKEDKEYQQDKEYKHIELKWIELTEDLDSESKLDRSPSFIQKMIACGEAQAEKFLEESLPLVGARTG